MERNEPHKSDWKENLRNRASLVNEQKFRHDLPYIKASDIGGQYFCEMKVNLDYVEGKKESESALEGAKIHDELLAMKKSTLEKIIENIESKKTFLAVFTLFAKFGNLIICGRPDAMVFSNGRPTFVIELKTTRGDVDRIYDSQLVQANIYSFLLDEMGFDCSKLQTVVTKIKRPFKLFEENKKEFLKLLVQSLFLNMSEEFEIKSKGAVFVHIEDYNRDQAINVIDKTKDYWIMNREPVPTKNPNKCRSCSFKSSCKFSLA